MKAMYLRSVPLGGTEQEDYERQYAIECELRELAVKDPSGWVPPVIFCITNEDYLMLTLKYPDFHNLINVATFA